MTENLGAATMHVVSEKSAADVAKDRALEDVSWSLRNLAANLIRVTRGAGKSYEITTQVRELVDALVGFQETAGHLPSGYDLERLLDIDHSQGA